MSILKEFASQEGMVRENHEMNLALNELRQIQESAPVINKFVYEADMLPVFRLEDAEEPTYCVEADMFKKMLDTKELTISEGVEELYKSISNQCDDCNSTNNLAIAFHHENIEEIDRGARSDPSKFSARCEAVIHRNDIVKAIINEGVKIVII